MATKKIQSLMQRKHNASPFTITEFFRQTGCSAGLIWQPFPTAKKTHIAITKMNMLIPLELYSSYISFAVLLS
jgi:hypothetical protein